MALFDANEIFRVNDKINGIVLTDPTRVDDDDIDLFLVKPPPVAVDCNLGHIPVESRMGELYNACTARCSASPSGSPHKKKDAISCQAAWSTGA
jgi:hypothetical protein